MDYHVNQSNGRVLDVTCNLCHKLIPFTQPQLSVDATEVIVFTHSCPTQELIDVQEAIPLNII